MIVEPFVGADAYARAPIMERIFISSLARGEMATIRTAAAKAVEALEMVPVMFETGAASGVDSRRTLLDRVAACDAVVLLLGAQYGEAVERGVSPTEEELQEAVRHNIPVLALVQDVDREQAQDDFLWRVRGGWGKGRLTRGLQGRRRRRLRGDQSAERVAAPARGRRRGPRRRS